MVKNPSTFNAGGPIPSLGREDTLGNEMATQSSICLGNPRDRGTGPATVHEVESDATY